ncbi:PhzF family phenazine biosynthesis isomerase [Streptomyces sp. ACA25]|uniref:PhzF family phenazine biosynthesis protein n=1 Tax=Streptomyces sp. ACA25 TaxID=3022596 RepID=UPI00230725DD|nr:PhzF family phenazine biosynthesis isomerase [Streptomyces sp. ACA25]MDB1087803.1 PhzF family phenazine biosynthesis isomerase [Streptomyces sp. ACA25]
MPSRTDVSVLHYTAFSASPEGGNPAGVVLDATGLDDGDMREIAAGVGYSETAFLTPPPPGLDAEPGRGFTIRYFSPLAEVPFCGHATVAASVAVAERLGTGELAFATRAGTVPVTVTEQDGTLHATLSSVEPSTEAAGAEDVSETLAALGWAADELDPGLPPRIAFAGARHLVLAAATRERLATLDYDFERLKNLLLRLGLVTVQLVWRDRTDPAGTVFHVRNPFPVGGVVEDPATGAAAAALGGYLRELKLVPGGNVRLTLHQGHDMGRPALLTVELRRRDPRVHVTGAAVAIPGR